MSSLPGGLELDVQRELRTTSPLRPVAAGLAVTVWGSLSKSLPSLRPAPSLLQAQPTIIILHLEPGAGAAPLVATVRRELPDVRVWLQSPANCLAGGAVDTAVTRARAWVRASIDLGAEVLSFNGEGRSAPRRPGWDFRTPVEGAEMAHRAALVLAACADEAAGRLVLAWSSHDCPLWHHLPWPAIFGPTSPVLLALHQHYPDMPGVLDRRPACVARVETSQAQWQQLADRGSVRQEFVPGEAGAIAYTQSHGISTEGVCAILDHGALAATWACPTRCDAPGLLALRADARLRARVGHEPGRAARFQRENGITPAVGVVGPITLGALGLTD